MTDHAKRIGSSSDEDREGAKLHGPALLRAREPVVLPGGDVIPAGKEFMAGGDLARRLYDQGLVEVLIDHGSAEPTLDGDTAARVEDELAKLERVKRRIDEAQDRAQGLRNIEAQAIERYLGNLEDFAEAAIRKHTGGSVSLRDLQSHSSDWNDDLLDGRTPAKLQGTSLETDRERTGALLSYVMLLQSLRANTRHGVMIAQSAARRAADTRAAEALTLKLQVQGEADRAQDHQEQVVQRMRAALELYDEALPDLLEALRIALGLLASMDPDDLLEHAHQRQRRQEAPRKLYRRAGIELFRRIIQGLDDTSLEKIWLWAGTTYYNTAEVEGHQFRFKKRNDQLEISTVGEDGIPDRLRVQKFVPSTLYEWRAAALKAPQSSG